MVVLTFDIDWAPDYMLEYLYKEISREDVKATFFLTHSSQMVKKIINNYDFGIHPNITDLTKAKEQTLQIKKLFPPTKKIRAHKLITNSQIMKIWSEMKFRIVSNYLMLGYRSISPIQLPFGLKEVPIFFMDDLWVYGGMNTLDQEQIKEIADSKSIFVFDFHPVHIYMNTCELKTYDKIKNNMSDENYVNNYRNKGFGCNSMLRTLIDSKVKIYSLQEMIDDD